MTQAQQKIIPVWKQGDAWHIKATATVPDKQKKFDEVGKQLYDTLRTEYIWRVEEESNDGFVLSIQMMTYGMVTGDESDEYSDDIKELYSGLKDLPPLRYTVDKEGKVLLKEQADKDDVDMIITAMAGMKVKEPNFINDSIIRQYVEKWDAARKARLDSLEEAGEPMPELVEVIHLDEKDEQVFPEIDDLSKKKRKGKKSKQEEEWVDDEWNYQSDDEEDWEEPWSPINLYVSTLKETFSKRVESLHTPFGTEIKQIGKPYSVEDITEQELANLNMSPEIIKMLKITGSYHFTEKEGGMMFFSDLSIDMQEFMRQLLKLYEEVFGEEEVKGKKKLKKEPSSTKSKASEQMPSIVMNMKSAWNFDSKIFVPSTYNMVVSTHLDENGVKMTFEAKEFVSLEKIE